METIYLLPNLDYCAFLDDDTDTESNIQVLRERYRLAATLDYIPDSLETLRAIEYSDLKLLMTFNRPFFDAAMDVCGSLVSKAIEFYKDCDDEGLAMEVSTLDELLNCGYFGPEYESARHEFANCFIEDFLFEE